MYPRFSSKSPAWSQKPHLQVAPAIPCLLVSLLPLTTLLCVSKHDHLSLFLSIVSAFNALTVLVGSGSLPVDFHNYVSADEKQHNPLPLRSVHLVGLTSREFCEKVGGSGCQHVRWNLSDQEYSVKRLHPETVSQFNHHGAAAAKFLVWFKGGSPAGSRASSPEKPSGRFFLSLAQLLTLIIVYSRFSLHQTDGGV